MCKKLWQTLCSVTVAIAIIVTSFLRPVKADTKTLDDVWSMLNSIDQALTAASSTRSGDLIYKFTQLKNDFEYIFGTSASGQGDGHINYVYNNQSVSGSTFNQAMGDMISQQNEILMSLVSSYVDASDPDNVIVQPGLFDRLTTIYNAVSSSATSDATIASYIDDITSETQQIRSILQNMNTYNIPLESLCAYQLFLKMNNATVNVDSSLKYPIVNVKSSIDGQYITSRKFQIPAGKTVVLAFMNYNSNNLSANNMPFFTYNGNQSNDLSVAYSFIGLGSNRRLWHIVITNNANFKNDVSFDFPFNVDVVPYYFGLENLMSSEMASAIMYYERESDNDLLHDIRDSLYNSDDGLSWLQKIYNHLIGDPDQNNKTQQDIDSMNQKVDQLQTSLDGYNDQFEAVQDDVDPSGLLTNIQGYSNQIGRGRNLIQDIYNSFGDIKWLFLLPLMIGLILLFVG